MHYELMELLLCSVGAPTSDFVREDLLGGWGTPKIFFPLYSPIVHTLS